MKTAFGQSWRHELCDKQILQGKIEPGNPALLVIALSALRSLELYRFPTSLSMSPVIKLYIVFTDKKLIQFQFLLSSSYCHCRGLTPFSKECPVVKLFSKHIKIQDQVVIYILILWKISELQTSYKDINRFFIFVYMVSICIHLIFLLKLYSQLINSNRLSFDKKNIMRRMSLSWWIIRKIMLSNHLVWTIY